MTPTPAPAPRPYPPAKVMYWVAFLHLLLVAGVVHRANHPQATRGEVAVLAYGLFTLWPLIVAETWVAVLIRDRLVRPLRPTLVRAILITLLPPLRMGMPDPFTGQMWIPGWGRCDRGQALEDRLDRVFHKPMLVFALLILPVLALEYIQADEVRSRPGWPWRCTSRCPSSGWRSRPSSSSRCRPSAGRSCTARSAGWTWPSSSCRCSSSP